MGRDRGVFGSVLEIDYKPKKDFPWLSQRMETSLSYCYDNKMEDSTVGKSALQVEPNPFDNLPL